MTRDEIIKRIRSCKAEAEAGWQLWCKQAQEDFQMAMGDQWPEDVVAKLVEKAGPDAPHLTIPLIPKHINVVSGIERQGRTDLKVMPIEGGDEDQAEVFSMVMKWIMADRNAEFQNSDAFKDALICGLGWLYTYIQFDDDPRNGDIGIRKPSPFNILTDPMMVERDLSDCRYLIYFKKLWKDDCARLYPNKKSEIMELQAGESENEYDLTTKPGNDQREKLEVIEFWHREIERVTYIMDSTNREDMERWTGKKKDLKEYLSANPTYVAINREVQQMRLSVLIEGKVLAYDGPSPQEGNDYPFTPIFCFYFSAYDDWAWKCQGIVRGLKDIQREKNKRRSVTQQAVGMMPHSFWKYESDALYDENDLNKAAGIGKKLRVRPGKMNAVEASPGPPIQPVLVQLEQMNDNDITMVGSNPDLLGQMLERGAPGVAIKLRQQQGVTVMQEIFDSYNYAKLVMGRKMIYLIANNFSIDKIKRIIGQDFYYTKNIKRLTEQLNMVLSEKPQVPEIPPQIDQSDELADKLASPDARAVLDHQIMADKNAKEMQLYQLQLADIQRRALAIKTQLNDLQQKEADFWVQFEREKREARYDCKVVESTSSPTFRYQVLSTLQELGKYNLLGPIPLPIMLELLSDLPKSLREEWLAYNQQMMMMQQGGQNAAQGQ